MSEVRELNHDHDHEHDHERMVVADHTKRDLPSIAHDLSVEDARDRMFQLGVDRLIVVEEGYPIGIIGRRELDLVESVGHEADTLDEAMRNPFVCDANAEVQPVATHMRKRGYSCALVVANGEPIGVFDAREVASEIASSPAAPVPAAPAPHEALPAVPPSARTRVRDLLERRHVSPGAGVGLWTRR
ncbi:MAG: CBS domain-containing protein [Myxococcales bacterium]|nr:CBS domain-containing protein [Myxococcales bacterium]